MWGKVLYIYSFAKNLSFFPVFYVFYFFVFFLVYEISLNWLDFRPNIMVHNHQMHFVLLVGNFGLNIFFFSKNFDFDLNPKLNVGRRFPSSQKNGRHKIFKKWGLYFLKRNFSTNFFKTNLFNTNFINTKQFPKKSNFQEKFRVKKSALISMI